MDSTESACVCKCTHISVTDTDRPPQRLWRSHLHQQHEGCFPPTPLPVGSTAPFTYLFIYLFICQTNGYKVAFTLSQGRLEDARAVSRAPVLQVLWPRPLRMGDGLGLGGGTASGVQRAGLPCAANVPASPFPPPVLP